MEISVDKLTAVLEESYECGLVGCRDFKKDDLDRILASCKPEQEYKIYSVQELQKMSLGTLFEHADRGRCWIEKRGGQNLMQFASGEVFYFASSDRDPWNKPMKLLTWTW